jgi:hypothetical protein
MVKNETQEGSVLSVDGQKFDASNLSDHAKAQLDNLQFVNEQILQKNNEIQIADSARLMYTSVLKEEFRKIGASD